MQFTILSRFHKCVLGLAIICFSHLAAQSVSIPYESIKGPTCIILDTLQKRALPFSPKFSRYNVTISDGFARIELTQTFINPGVVAAEMVYAFPLPHLASVHSMQMQYKDSLYIAKIYEKEEAIHLYDSIKNSGGKASLLLQERPNLFQQKIAGLPSKDTAYIRIVATMPLAFLDSVYELALPTMIASRFGTDLSPDLNGASWNPPADRSGQSIEINILLQTGVTIHSIVSPTHSIEIRDVALGRQRLESVGLLKKETPIHGEDPKALFLSTATTYPNKDFVLRFMRQNQNRDFSLATYYDADRKKGFFNLTLFPSLTDTTGNSTPREIILLVDRSGSQGGWPLDKEKEIAKTILTKLGSKDRYAVLSFDDIVDWGTTFNQLVDVTPANIQSSSVFINALTARGGTQLLSAIQTTLAIPMHDGANRIYFFLTDGFITNETEILNTIKSHPTHPTIFTFGAGDNLNRYFLDEAAKVGNGFSTIVTQTESAATLAEETWNRVSAPQWSHVQVNFGTAITSQIVSPISTNLYKGQPYSIYGWYHSFGTVDVELSGYIQNTKQTLRKSIAWNSESNAQSFLPQVWAKQKIDRLTYDQGSTTAKKDSIILISKDYQVLSAYTAFLAARPVVVTPDNNIGWGSPTETPYHPAAERALLCKFQNGNLHIDFGGPEEVKSIAIYDMQGRLVYKYIGQKGNLTHTWSWDGKTGNKTLPPGRYIAQITLKNKTLVYPIHLDF